MCQIQPEWARCYQHRAHSGLVLSHYANGHTPPTTQHPNTHLIFSTSSKLGVLSTVRHWLFFCIITWRSVANICSMSNVRSRGWPSLELLILGVSMCSVCGLPAMVWRDCVRVPERSSGRLSAMIRVYQATAYWLYTTLLGCTQDQQGPWPTNSQPYNLASIQQTIEASFTCRLVSSLKLYIHIQIHECNSSVFAIVIVTL